MSTVSLELCKELFELSGWNDTEKCWFGQLEDSSGNAPIIKHVSRWIVDHPAVMWRYPAYDLGYLLRKLGNLHVELKRPYIDSETINLWSCMAVYDDGEELPAYLVEGAFIPEDAACKLAISLFKHGVLKKGQE